MFLNDINYVYIIKWFIYIEKVIRNNSTFLRFIIVIIKSRKIFIYRY